jgi:DNA invertase Pin-like site-specific DNA recombinase
MKVALYCRVSTGRQTNENQALILKKHAERMGWDYEFFEEKESTRKRRPVKFMLMQRLRNKEFDAVCVLKLDRWGRSNVELALEMQELQDKGVDFISVRDNIDLSTATGKLQFHIISCFAEFERDLNRERTLDGLARARANGVKIGRPKGSKDSYKRKRSGYHLRHAAEKTRKKYEGLV